MSGPLEHHGFIEVTMTREEFGRRIRAPLSYEDDLALAGMVPSLVNSDIYGKTVRVLFFPRGSNAAETRVKR